MILNAEVASAFLECTASRYCDVRLTQRTYVGPTLWRGSRSSCILYTTRGMQTSMPSFFDSVNGLTSHYMGLGTLVLLQAVELLARSIASMRSELWTQPILTLSQSDFACILK